MRVFLTSSPCCPCEQEGIDIPCQWNEENEFVKNLSDGWNENSQCLIISADPENYEMNDEMCDTFGMAFEYAGLSLADIAVCDSRNAQDIQWLIQESDILILGGGHVPTQNAFFRELGLKELLCGFSGIVMGISAGSMNCARIVYAQPELEGESEDPEYQRYMEGLGLTELMILPHYQEVREHMLDGKQIIEDITCPDSMGNRFYALVDGSYVLCEDDNTTIYGEAYLIQDGEITQICEQGQRIRFTGINYSGE